MVNKLMVRDFGSYFSLSVTNFSYSLLIFPLISFLCNFTYIWCQNSVLKVTVCTCFFHHLYSLTESLHKYCSLPITSQVLGIYYGTKSQRGSCLHGVWSTVRKTENNNKPRNVTKNITQINQYKNAVLPNLCLMFLV